MVDRLIHDRLLKNKRSQISYIVWTYMSFTTALAPIDLLGYFNSCFDFNLRFSSIIHVPLIVKCHP